MNNIPAQTGNNKKQNTKNRVKTQSKNEFLCMETPYTIPVILTGTIARAPRAALTGTDRTVECLLNVRPRHRRHPDRHRIQTA